MTHDTGCKPIVSAEGVRVFERASPAAASSKNGRPSVVDLVAVHSRQDTTSPWGILDATVRRLNSGLHSSCIPSMRLALRQLRATHTAARCHTSHLAATRGNTDLNENIEANSPGNHTKRAWFPSFSLELLGVAAVLASSSSIIITWLYEPS